MEGLLLAPSCRTEASVKGSEWSEMRRSLRLTANTAFCAKGTAGVDVERTRTSVHAVSSANFKKDTREATARARRSGFS
jgi:hypothetical protein